MNIAGHCQILHIASDQIRQLPFVCYKPERMLHLVVAGAFTNIEKKWLADVLPLRLRTLWKDWQLRALVVSSLVLQIALILSGKRRKYSGFIWLRLFVWSTYLLADWVAAIALGVIANNIQGCPGDKAPPGYDLTSFWAPFLLVHLGGPDTITAYSLEDNELWQRRTVELITQTAVAIYITVTTWPAFSSLSLLTIPMLIVGIIKFGERIGSLRSASSEQFRDSLLTPPDPGPNYAKFMEDFTLKKAEGFYVKADVVVEASAPTALSDAGAESQLSLKAYALFQSFKRLFVDLILSFQDRDESQSFFSKLEPEKAFHVIEVELGFVYDALYTKAPVVYSATGCVLRFITMLLTSIVLILFPFISKGKPYHAIDLVITYLLISVAILLELVALLVLLFSDWTTYWLCKHYSNSNSFLLRHISLRKPGKRWSSLMAQYNLLDVCLEKERPRIQKLLMFNKKLEKHLCLTYSSVSTDLKRSIFEHCSTISQHIKNSKDLTALCRSRGDYALDKCGLLDELKWSTTEAEFDHSILLWHIATELCCCCDSSGESSGEPLKRVSKEISDYMLYLLAMCPFMLPIGIGMIRFRDTCAEAKEFFKDKKPIKDAACKMLLRVNTEVLPSLVKGDRSKSVLFDACRLAARLRKTNQDEKWKIISNVWVEILGYAATHCRGTQHAQRLRKGGELLTHVWFLMAHLGITEQLQIAQGHARAKLNAK